MKRIVIIGLLLQEAARGWIEHRAQRLGASLAFYTTLALAPLSMIAMRLLAISTAPDHAEEYQRMRAAVNSPPQKFEEGSYRI